MGKVDREISYLSLNSFKSIIEQLGDRIWYLLLFNQGEPFLNPHLIEFIELAKQKRIYVSTSTNGHFLTDRESVQKLVTSGLDVIIISLDGADPETYKIYRKGGNFHQVINGINNILIFKKRYGLNTPKVIIQCLVMKHNENQLHQMKKLRSDLKVDRLLFKTFQIESEESGQQFLPTDTRWRRYQIENGKISPKNSLKGSCSRLWYSAVILSDGRVVPCCFDKNGEHTFGVITQKTTFTKIWKSDAYNRFRNKILQGSETISICQNCTQNQTVYI